MKAVFVGSSSAAQKHARAVCRYLASLGVTPLPWWEQFSPGSVTIEVLEEVLESACGAVLLATPDDLRVSGEHSQHVSRDNVILELGMFSARLGRRNVALLRYDDVVLPTDLSGFTHVKMGPFDAAREVRSISAAARAQIQSWAGGLQSLAPGIARTGVHHGYSGRWHASMSFSRWWDTDILAPSYVNLDGTVDICLPPDGQGGVGLLVSQIDVYLHEPRGNLRLRSVQTLEQVGCDALGRLRIASNVFCREIVERSGAVPDQGGFQQKIAAPMRFITEAAPLEGPTDPPRFLRGVSSLTASDRVLSTGVIELEKV